MFRALSRTAWQGHRCRILGNDPDARGDGQARAGPGAVHAARRAAVAGDATSLMAALGYAPLEGLPGRYEFRTATTPVVLRRLALASASLQAALREEPTRRAAQRFDHLPPEPALGVSGTTTLTLLSASTPPQRRRYEADDVLEKVMGWLRAASERSVDIEDVALVHPRRGAHRGSEANAARAGPLAVGDAQARGDAPPPPPPPRPSNKPKPSDNEEFRGAQTRGREGRGAGGRRHRPEFESKIVIY